MPAAMAGPGQRTDTSDTPPARASWALPAEARSVAEIRSGVRAFATAHGAPDAVVADIALAVSEVVTNAVMHAFVGRELGTVTAEAMAGVDELTVVIADDGRGMQPRSDSPGLGLGLPLTAQLASNVDLRQSAAGGAELSLTFAAAGVAGALPADPGADARLLEAVARTASGAWPGEGVERLAHLLVPDVADACAVDVVDGSGQPRRFVGRIDGPRAQEDSVWLAGLRPRTDAGGSATRAVLAEGETRISELTPELIDAITGNDEDAARMTATGIRWWVVVPLHDDGGRLLGLLHFGMRPGRGRPSAQERARLDAIGARAASALAANQLASELSRARRRFERILDAIPAAVTLRGADGRLVYANEAAARLLGAAGGAAVVGWTPEAVAGRLGLTRLDGSPLDLAELPGHLATDGRPAPPLLARAVDPATGAERRLRITSARVDDDEPLAVAVIEDVTPPAA
jgi:anti-sigma regulatory factor (Ser/Thr protein kinase)/PAS domain-containing protein